MKLSIVWNNGDKQIVRIDEEIAYYLKNKIKQKHTGAFETFFATETSGLNLHYAREFSLFDDEEE